MCTFLQPQCTYMIFIYLLSYILCTYFMRHFQCSSFMKAHFQPRSVPAEAQTAETGTTTSSMFGSFFPKVSRKLGIDGKKIGPVASHGISSIPS